MKTMPALAATGVALSLSATVSASLSFALSPASRTVLPGGTAIFSGTVANLDSDDAYAFQGLQFDGSDPSLAFDGYAFLMGVPASLGRGESWTGELFTVAADASFVDAFAGSVTVLGGTMPGQSDPLAIQSFGVSPQAVPEPTTLLVLASLGALALRRRKSLPNA